MTRLLIPKLELVSKEEEQMELENLVGKVIKGIKEIEGIDGLDRIKIIFTDNTELEIVGNYHEGVYYTIEGE